MSHTHVHPRRLMRLLTGALALAFIVLVTGPALPAAATPMEHQRTITVGGWAEYLTISPDGSTLYVSDPSNDRLHIVDVVSRTVEASLPTGFYPSEVAISPDGSTAYLGHVFEEYVLVIDTATRTVIDRIDTQRDTSGVVLSPDGSTIYTVAGWPGNGFVEATDTATHENLDSVTVGAYAQALTLSPDGSTLYATNIWDDSVSEIDVETFSVTATIAVGSFPHATVVSPDGATLYTTDTRGGYISVIDATTRTVIADIEVPAEPVALGISHDGSTIYSANSDDNSMSVIDTATHTVVETHATGKNPYAIEIAPDGTVFVGNADAGTVSVFNHLLPPATVTFHSNGGHGTMDTQTREAGDVGALTENSFTFDDHNFAGWNTQADGSGQAYADGATYPFDTDATLYAQWSSTVIASLVVHGSTSMTEGESDVLVAEGFNAAGDSLGDVTDHVTWVSSYPEDRIRGAEVTYGFDPEALGGSGISALTAFLTDDPSVSAVFAVDVTSAAVGIELNAPANASQGDTIMVRVNALDSQGHVLGDVTDWSVITSSVDTDEITGNHVHFVGASPHVLTASIPGVPGFTAHVSVEVAQVTVPPVDEVPAPAAPEDSAPEALGLAATGADPLGAAAVALALVVTGGVVLIRSRGAKMPRMR